MAAAAYNADAFYRWHAEVTPRLGAGAMAGCAPGLGLLRPHSLPSTIRREGSVVPLGGGERGESGSRWGEVGRGEVRSCARDRITPNSFVLIGRVWWCSRSQMCQVCIVMRYLEHRYLVYYQFTLSDA
jgi:hypothetical protein